MKEGKNIARITDYGLTKTKLGSAQIFIKVDFLEGGSATWYGVAFKKNGEPNDMCLKQLAYCGFDFETNTIDQLAYGPLLSLLRTDDIDVYCRHETAPNGEQVLRINSIGELFGPQRVEADEAKQMLDKDALEKLKNAGSKFKAHKKNKSPVSSFSDDDTKTEIPF